MKKDYPYRGSDHPFDADDDIFELMGEENHSSPYQEKRTPKNSRPQKASSAKQEKEIQKGSAAKQTKPHKTGKKSKKAKKKKHRSLAERMATLFVTVLLCCATGLCVYLGAACANDELWLSLENIPYNTATVLYAQNEVGEWEEYASIPCTQNKVFAADDEIPDMLQNAFVAVEDKDFYRHSGVNVKRTAFAIFNEAVYAVSGKYPGGVRQGASTIDQQLIKNLTREDESSGIIGYLRKIKEIYRAYKLDAKYEKETILNAYLNTISFTDNTAGVKAAAQKIFGCEPNQLSIAQCASLAAITRSPARYNPETHPQEHITRRNYVLEQMEKQGYITESELQAALAEPLVTTGNGDPKKTAEVTDWFTDLVMEAVISDLASEKGLSRTEASRLLYNGGLQIYTTVVPALQRAVETGLASASVYPRPGVAVTKPLTDEAGQQLLDENGTALTQQVTVRPQAAMISLNYKGEICAVSGGLGQKEESRSYNRATMAVRQVGSTMKPIGPYVVALEENRINWSTAFMDTAVKQIEDETTGEKKDWPRNFSGTYSEQNILVNEAVARSINTIAVRVGQKAGIGNIYRFATQKLNISTFIQKDKAAAPMVLGASTYGVTPLEMAAAYSIFGSGGSYTTPHCYTSVQSGTGQVLLTPKIETKQVISTDTAYVMNRLLRGVMEGDGTGAGYSVPGGMDSVGKTGTTSDDRDHWFIGLTPYYVTASWYGYDENLSLSVNYSAHPPTLAWRNAMSKAQQNLQIIEFPVDETVVTQKYCTVTGQLAGDSCPAATGYYRADGVPKSVCSLHK